MENVDIPVVAVSVGMDDLDSIAFGDDDDDDDVAVVVAVVAAWDTSWEPLCIGWECIVDVDIRDLLVLETRQKHHS